MELIHRTDYFTFSFDAEKSLMTYNWFPESRLMNEAAYRAEMTANAEACEKYSPRVALVDLRDFLFTIGPELQAWTDEEIFTRFIKAGLRKIGFIVSSDVFAQVSLEQMMEENVGLDFQTRYFDENEEEAMKWLVEE